ncbi:NrdH-redoxin [Candidatus Uhrbacteria bacterium]|nr:NrdH-redoxin [Candidatus Uhrbacteria bacterium]
MKKVIIYTTPTCGYCKMAKAYFKDNNIAYIEKDVAIDQSAADEMINKSGQMGVPVIAISDEDGGNEQLIIGFDQSALASALGIGV